MLPRLCHSNSTSPVAMSISWTTAWIATPLRRRRRSQVAPDRVVDDQQRRALRRELELVQVGAEAVAGADAPTGR